MKPIWIMLWGLALPVAIHSSTNSYPERLMAIQGLTNPPPAYRVVFDYWQPQSMLSGMYEVEAQPEHWKAKYSRMARTFLDPRFTIVGAGTPHHNWLIQHGKTNQWLAGEKEGFGPIARNRTHGELSQATMLAERLMSLGIAHSAKGEFILNGDDFHWTDKERQGRQVTGSFQKTKSGRLIGATIRVMQRNGDMTGYDLRYVFKADKFNGEFPVLIERWENDSVLREKFEILEYEPKAALQPPGAFGLEAVLQGPQL